jgi:hypothetical protein
MMVNKVTSTVDILRGIVFFYRNNFFEAGCASLSVPLRSKVSVLDQIRRMYSVRGFLPLFVDGKSSGSK